MAMKVATLCFLLCDGEICLAMKKRGFGEGKYNGFGGKVGDKQEFKDETLQEALKKVFFRAYLSNFMV